MLIFDFKLAAVARFISARLPVNNPGALHLAQFLILEPRHHNHLTAYDLVFKREGMLTIEYPFFIEYDTSANIFIDRKFESVSVESIATRIRTGVFIEMHDIIYDDFEENVHGRVSKIADTERVVSDIYNLIVSGVNI